MGFGYLGFGFYGANHTLSSQQQQDQEWANIIKEESRKRSSCKEAKETRWVSTTNWPPRQTPKKRKSSPKLIIDTSQHPNNTKQAHIRQGMEAHGTKNEGTSYHYYSARSHHCYPYHRKTRMGDHKDPIPRCNRVANHNAPWSYLVAKGQGEYIARAKRAVVDDRGVHRGS